ncbi:MAG: hypothetical protein JW829_14415 [Pirellulales bacterium]|nr:hypothetical protein [Pirellulales bacterium]
MNTCRCRSAFDANRWWLVLPVFGLWFTVSGCNTGGDLPPPESRLHIENVAKWYSLYRADHAGKTPVGEKEFVEFIENKMKSRGTPVDRDQLLTSPRDGQRYVINYGKPTSTSPEKNVAVYEKEGYHGKKLVGFEFGNSRELDEAELKSLMAGS